MSSSALGQWSCRICGAVNDGEQSTCWVCQRRRGALVARVPRRALLAGGLAGAGALFLSGLLWQEYASGTAPLQGATAPFISPYPYWSPRLTYVAIREANGNAHNSRVEIHAGQTRQLISAFEDGEAIDIYWSLDETRILLGASIWRIADGKQVGRIERIESPNTVAWSPDGQHIASASLGKLQIWSVIDGQLLFTYTLSADSDPIALCWSPDNRSLAFAGGFWSQQNKGMVGVIGGIWKMENPKRIRDLSATLQKGIDFVDRGALSWSPDGAHIALGDGSGTLGILSVSNGSMTSLIKKDLDFVAWPIAWSPDGKFLAACRKGAVEVWRIADSQRVQRFESGLHPFWALTWTADGSQIRAVDTSRKIQNWKIG
ncbi:MAG: hypothetical protein JOZ18_06045 [Chloroflexi bacterium]|nr:hypothetical protein [Chloroflexota bacterium]